MTVRSANARPLLADMVRDGLRRAVITGTWPPGDKLPNEDALAERFNVSRATIREAVRGLVEEWAKLHQEELARMWDSKDFHSIDPLI